MGHWREMMDSKSKYVASWDLKGHDVTLRIAKVTGDIVEDKVKGTKDRKPAIHFEPRPGASVACKPLVGNVTNCKAIGAMYGNDPNKWKGKYITIYPTTTSVGGEVKDCIRVRPQIPSGADVEKSKSQATPTDDDGLAHPGADE